MMRNTRLLWRELVLAGAGPAGDGTAAFTADGELRLQLTPPVPGSELGAGEIAAAARALGLLAGAVSRTAGDARWSAAYGSSPVELASEGDLQPAAPLLAAAFEDADTGEAACMLAHLALAGGSPEPLRLRPRPLRALPAPGGPLLLALGLHTGEVPDAVRLFRRHGGPGCPFWLADRSLAVRFRVTADRVTFRSRHPLLQAELVAACEREGIDLT